LLRREAGTISIAANLSPSFNFIALTPLVARFLALNCKAHHQNHLCKTKKIQFFKTMSPAVLLCLLKQELITTTYQNMGIVHSKSPSESTPMK